MKFEELNLNEDIMTGIRDAGFTECMPAQEKTFKAVFEGKDVTVQSQTGTGKTAAFLISIYQLFLSDSVEKKKALIIVPTRELAVQIEEESEILGKALQYKTVSIYGGVGYKKQLENLKAGADLVVGTPGRLLDLEKSNSINFKEFGVLVIDEADRLFDMGFLPDLRKMLRRMPPPAERRTMLFSATLNTRVLNLAWDQMNEYEEIKIEPEKMTVEEISQELYHVASHEKFNLLLGILKKESFENMIIFCNTKHKAVEVAKRLEVNGYKCKFLMGDLPQKKRLEVIQSMKAGNIQILVATDVAARGLHVDDLPVVINYDLPEDYENYVHRIGRTARAGKSGRAISLACEQYVFHLPAIEGYIGDKISVMIADDDLFAEDASADMKFNTRSYDDERRGGGSRNSSQRNGRNSGRRNDSRGGRSGSGGGGDRRRREGSDRPRPEGQRRNPERSGSSSGYKDREKAAGSRTGNRHSENGNGSRKNNYNRRGPDNKKRDFVKKPESSSSMEDRLAYYKAKYGEDFKPSEEMMKKSGAKSAPKKSAPKKNNQKKPVVPAPSASAAPEKTGFFKKLFGKKK